MLVVGCYIFLVIDIFISEIGLLFVIFGIIITTIIFIPIVKIYLYLNTFFVIL